LCFTLRYNELRTDNKNIMGELENIEFWKQQKELIKKECDEFLRLGIVEYNKKYKVKDIVIKDSKDDRRTKRL